MNAPFEGYDEATLVFYRRLLTSVMMNAHAVRMGHFDTLLCETDDPRVARRWQETLPKIGALMREANRRAAEE